MSDKLIYGKIAAIQKAVGAIPKNGKGPAQKGGFAFIKAEDVLDKVHALLVENEVIVIPTIEYSKHETRIDGSRSYITATVSISYEYIAVEDGSSVVTTSVGEGSDIGSDTATRKAATQALKISHLHMFTIPNSEFDDEGYEPVDKGGEAKQNRAVAQAQNGKVTGATSASQNALNKVRAQVKVAGEKLGLTPAQINERGLDVDPDFFASEAHLKTLLTVFNEELKDR